MQATFRTIKKNPPHLFSERKKVQKIDVLATNIDSIVKEINKDF